MVALTAAGVYPLPAHVDDASVVSVGLLAVGLLGNELPRRVASVLGAWHEVLHGVGHCLIIEDPDRFCEALWRAIREG